MRFKQLSALFFSVAMLFSSIVKAQIPTTDIANLVQQLLGYAEQLEAGLNQIEDLKTQYDQLENTAESLEALTGAKNISDILNNPLLKEIRRQVPYDTLRVIDDLAEGKLPRTNGEFKRTLGSLYKLYPSLEKTDYYRYSRYDREKNELTQRSQSLDVVKTGTLHTQLETAEIHLDTVEGLISEIDSTKDLKASVDLNTRMVGEMVLQLNHFIRLYTTNELVPSEKEMIDREMRELMNSANDLKKD